MSEGNLGLPVCSDLGHAAQGIYPRKLKIFQPVTVLIIIQEEKGTRERDMTSLNFYHVRTIMVGGHTNFISPSTLLLISQSISIRSCLSSWHRVFNE